MQRLTQVWEIKQRSQEKRKYKITGSRNIPGSCIDHLFLLGTLKYHLDNVVNWEFSFDDGSKCIIS